MLNHVKYIQATKSSTILQSMLGKVHWWQITRLRHLFFILYKCSQQPNVAEKEK